MHNIFLKVGKLTCMHDVCACMLLLDKTEQSTAELESIDYSVLNEDCHADEEYVEIGK